MEKQINDLATNLSSAIVTKEVTDIQYNPQLDPNLFNFKPPADAAIIDYR